MTAACDLASVTGRAAGAGADAGAAAPGDLTCWATGAADATGGFPCNAAGAGADAGAGAPCGLACCVAGGAEDFACWTPGAAAGGFCGLACCAPDAGVCGGCAFIPCCDPGAAPCTGGAAPNGRACSFPRGDGDAVAPGPSGRFPPLAFAAGGGGDCGFGIDLLTTGCGPTGVTAGAAVVTGPPVLGAPVPGAFAPGAFVAGFFPAPAPAAAGFPPLPPPPPAPALGGGLFVRAFSPPRAFFPMRGIMHGPRESWQFDKLFTSPPDERFRKTLLWPRRGSGFGFWGSGLRFRGPGAGTRMEGSGSRIASGGGPRTSTLHPLSSILVPNLPPHAAGDTTRCRST